jgi:hypothetical protein
MKSVILPVCANFVLFTTVDGLFDQSNTADDLHNQPLFDVGLLSFDGGGHI